MAQAMLRAAVLTYPVTPWVLFAALGLRRQFPRVRFVFYVMDDWEGHHTCFGLPFTARRRSALREMVDTADVRFACSHRMKADYEQRFGNAWGVLHKGVAIDASLPAMTPLARPWNIFYAGGMNIFRADAVIAFCEGLRRFREHTGHLATLTLLGAGPNAQALPELAPYDFVRVEPWVDQSECRNRMAAADLLYLPLSMLPTLERIANLAMPIQTHCRRPSRRLWPSAASRASAPTSQAASINARRGLRSSSIRTTCGTGK
jgi:hypothetical protein